AKKNSTGGEQQYKEHQIVEHAITNSFAKCVCGDSRYSRHRPGIGLRRKFVVREWCGIGNYVLTHLRSLTSRILYRRWQVFGTKIISTLVREGCSGQDST